MSLSKTLFPLLSTGSTQEDPSRQICKHLKKLCSISYMMNFLIATCSDSEKSPFVVNLRAKPSIFFMEKISFSLKL